MSRLISNFRLAVEGNAVLRFHAVRTLRKQTVGEHVSNMLGLYFSITDEPSMDIVRAILVHDMAEQYTGDIAAPAKVDNPDFDKALDVVEALWMEKYGIFPAHKTMSPVDTWVLNWLDIVDLCYFCKTDLAMGNTMIAPMYRRALKYLEILMNNECFSLLPEEMQGHMGEVTDTVGARL
jgi:hypothetical protein